ncbi:hypothetical protein B0A49_10731, partial [Cryomyces minteri]
MASTPPISAADTSQKQQHTITIDLTPYVPAYPVVNHEAAPQLPPDVDPASPQSIFDCFFSDEILETIAKHTNSYAE